MFKRNDSVPTSAVLACVALVQALRDESGLTTTEATQQAFEIFASLLAIDPEGPSASDLRELVTMISEEYPPTSSPLGDYPAPTKETPQQ